MAIKGAIAKQEVAKTILNTFGDKAFLYNDGKEIRINCMESGELVQIKVALTAAKVAVESGSDSALPMAAAPIPKAEMIDFSDDAPAVPTPAPVPTEQEKKNIVDLMRQLGL